MSTAKWISKKGLRVGKRLQDMGNTCHRFFEAFALGALGNEERTLLTAELYAADRRRRRGLFDWERDWLERDLPAPPARVLLGGAGRGREVEALLGRGYSLVCFDPVTWSPHLTGALKVLEGTYEQLVNPKDGSSEKFARAVEESVPYDAVLLGWGSFTHLTNRADREGLLQACRRLCPKGPLLLSFWLAHPLMTHRFKGRVARLGHMIGRLLSDRASETESLSPNDSVMAHCGYAHHFTWEELEALAERSGYKIFRREGAPGGVYPHATFLPGR